MKYIYGPVKSRRLGLSLGLSIIPHKTCNFDCLYCQLGKTINRAEERKEYVKIEDILAELKEFFSVHKDSASSLNYITFSGSGEPTLNLKIEELISRIKKITSIPIAVITNSSLLIDDKVRLDLLNADVILPSLDAASQDILKKINQPADNLKIDDIIEGLVRLRKEFKGKIWLEIMLVKGLNDSRGHIKKLREVISSVNPDKIQLNSPVRTTAEPNIFPVDKKELEKIKEILGDRCEII